MPRSEQATGETLPGRRQFVAAIAGAGALGWAASEPASAQIARTMEIPAVDEFEGNYVGQLLTVFRQEQEATTVEELADGCPELPWPVDETERADGQLTEDTLFVVDGSTPCSGEYVMLETVSVPVSSLVGKDPGPTVTASDGGQPGPGPALGAAGVAGALLLRAFRSRGE